MTYRVTVIGTTEQHTVRGARELRALARKLVRKYGPKVEVIIKVL